MVKTLVRSPVIFFLSLLATLSFAQTALLNSSAQQPSIHSFAYIGNDSDNKTDKTLWLPLTKNQAQLNNPQKHSLLRVELSAHKNLANYSYLLELDTKEIQSVDVYLYDQQSEELTLLNKDMGLLHAFSNRPISYRNLTIPINFHEKPSLTYLFHIEHSYPQKIQFKLWPEKTFTKKLNSELIFFGMIYGSLLMIIIYNLFVYISLKEKNHLWFFLFGGLTGLFISFHEGHFFQFIAIDSPWPKDLIYSTIIAVMCVCFSIFSSYFLDLKKQSLLLNKALLAAGSITAAFILLLGSRGDDLAFAPYSLLAVLILYSIAIGIGLSIWYKGITSAGFFALAIFLCSSGIFAEFISHLSINELAITNYSLASIGNTAMLFVFAFALADKMRQLNKDRLDASQKLVHMTEEKAQSNIEIYKSKISEIQTKQKAQAALVEAKAKNEFLATMGHEIRTPMSGVIGMTELLNDTELSDEQSSYVDSIKNSSNALLNVINGLLDYSKIESGGMDLEARAFDLEQLIDNCIDLFALSAVEKNLNFTAFIKPHTPTQLKGDSEKLKQITLNLLNSICEIPGINSISLQASATDKVSVNSVEILFDIHVRGSELNKESILNWFKQLDEDSEVNNSSSILNVRVSRQLLELMHGDLRFDLSDDGFSLSYNARLLTPNEDQRDITSEREKILSNRRVLVCHENPEILELIQQLSNSWGMECSIAADSKEVAEILLDDKKAFQALIIEDKSLTPELQINVRQSNVNHNFTTAVIVINNNQAITEDELKKRGIQCLLTPPFTTIEFYHSMIQSMGMEPEEDEPDFIENDISILVAEDNNINLMVIQGMLKKIGVIPDVATNGEEAIFKAKNQHYDLIFMDCEMPIKDGYEATMAIRKLEQEEYEEKPSLIIALSAHDDAKYRGRAEESGMDDFLTKPINSNDLNNILKQFIDRGKPLENG